MAVSATVTPALQLSENESVTISKLNQMASPTVDVSGSIGTLSLSDGSVTNAKVATGAAVQYDKLAALATGELVVGNAGTPTATALSGDATISATGVLTLAANALMPSGALIQYVGSSAPTGWLMCDGSEVDRTTYADLFAVISTDYGDGDESTTFNLPDLRGRAAIGAGTGRDNAGSGSITARTAGTYLGEESVTLTGAESGTAAHTHVYYSKSAMNQIDRSTTYGKWGRDDSPGQYKANTESSTEADASSAHENMSPFVVVGGYIIKT